ncbi:ABC-2 type transport system permease protein [Virgibacillus natechei]|uniref:ABC-2 type transport system permease protein n=1 Tax=Virgibacillus natechei TaxID=1216297 RepID=A0ABS4IJ48_9BACI|nr:ABC transporter permease subunit [Virgibacillus natechei]MBP1970595.1 ABC-2 type transport system permease protein [Virgibacillus natechei]UZD14008.1 ABC transporter permease [Virgibacillus natechei]
MQWSTLFKKEMLENWRNKKWIWVPLVIILIAIIDPISNYYLPQIIESVGGMPEGASIDLPEFTPADVVMMSLGQLSSLGVLVIVLISMGIIAGERKSGVSELILVKPVSYQNYITAKWAALLVLVWGSLFLGMLASWYYTNILFGHLSLLAFLQIVFFYGLWLTLVVTVSIFYNTLFKTPGLVAFLTIITIMLMSIITQIFGHLLTWSPVHLSSYIHEMLITGSISSDLVATGLVTIVITIILLAASVFTLKNKELGN